MMKESRGTCLYCASDTFFDVHCSVLVQVSENHVRELICDPAAFLFLHLEYKETLRYVPDDGLLEGLCKLSLHRSNIETLAEAKEKGGHELQVLYASMTWSGYGEGEPRTKLSTSSAEPVILALMSARELILWFIISAATQCTETGLAR
jgi:hypothetical protein